MVVLPRFVAAVAATLTSLTIWCHGHLGTVSAQEIVPPIENVIGPRLPLRPVVAGTDRRAPGDLFGSAVAIAGSRAIVGSPNRDNRSDNDGEAFVFDVVTGDLIRSLTPNSASEQDQFGSSVDMNEQFAIVGAPRADDKLGAAFVFDFEGNQIAKLVGTNRMSQDRFGFSVAAHSEFAAVGAPTAESPLARRPGKAFLYTNVADCGEACQPTRTLTAADVKPEDSFGFAVAVNSNYAIVGAPGPPPTGGNRKTPGKAYVFDPASGGLLFTLASGLADDADSFGFATAVSGNIAIIGAPDADTIDEIETTLDQGVNTGAVFVFDLQACQEQQSEDGVCSTWIHRLVAEDSSSLDLFGASVDLTENFAVVGAPLSRHAIPSADPNLEKTNTFPGGAYLFDTKRFEMLDKLNATRDKPNREPKESVDAFGVSVGLAQITRGDNTSVNVIAGAMQEDLANCTGDAKSNCNSGSAYLFEYPIQQMPPVTEIELRAGDADRDFDFDQLDLVKVQVSAKYLSGAPATWGEGDWNGAPGGSRENPPSGDNAFNQLDVVAALTANIYLTGPYMAQSIENREGGQDLPLVYDARSGEIWVNQPLGTEVMSIQVSSESVIFADGSTDRIVPAHEFIIHEELFKGSLSRFKNRLSIGSIVRPSLSEHFVRNDLKVKALLADGRVISNFAWDYIAVPEPTSLVIALAGVLFLVYVSFIKRMNGSRLIRSIICMIAVTFVVDSFAADPETGIVTLKADGEYGNTCQDIGESCVELSGERFGRFFANRSWKVRIDPLAVREAIFDVSFEPADRLEFRGVRFLNGYFQPSAAIPPRVVIPGGNNNRGFVENIHVATDAPPLENVDIIELIFADREPFKNPAEVGFTAQASLGDFVNVVDTDTGVVTRFIAGQITADPAVFRVPEPDHRLLRDGKLNDDRYSFVYHPSTGEVELDIAIVEGADQDLSALFLQSVSGRFIPGQEQQLGGSFDFIQDRGLFKTVFAEPSTGFGSISFGNIAPTNLTEDDLLADILTHGARAEGGAAGFFDLVYVNNPEPSSLVLSLIGIMTFMATGARRFLVRRIRDTIH